MKPDELRRILDTEAGAAREWPKTYEVDAETYGEVCKVVLESAAHGTPVATVAVGPSGGIMFKNTELLVKDEAGNAVR